MPCLGHRSDTQLNPADVARELNVYTGKDNFTFKSGQLIVKLNGPI